MMLEITGRDAAQVQDRQQSIKAGGPSSPARQQRRTEPDPLGCRARSPIADPDPLNLDRPDPGLDHALRSMTMPDQPVPAISQLQVFTGGQESYNLSFNGLLQQLACS
jgi:hypothetical protein